MRSKLLIAAGLVVAFVLGTVTSGLLSGTASAFQKSDPVVTTSQPEAAVVPPPRVATAVAPRQIARTSYATARPVAVSSPVRTAAQKRSLKKEALIVGGSAGAGAAIGAVAGGGKGAALGALSGGAAGLVYDLLTRNKS
jgi:cysteine synthase